MILPEIVYGLCLLTTFLCTVLLFRGYMRTKARLLLWSTICFFCFTINNALVIVDLVLTSQTLDLSVERTIPGFIGVFTMIYGLIFDVERT